jgi:hypothetical protein
MVISITFNKRLPPAAANAGRGTLAELMAKQKAAADAQSAAAQQPSPTIMQGIGNLAQVISGGIREGRAERDLREQQAGMNKLLGEVDPLQGATNAQIAAAGEYDPKLMETLWADRSTKLREDANRDNWQPLNPSEKGRYGIAADDPVAYKINIKTGDVEPINKAGKGDTINVGGESDPFFKKLDEKSGETWAQYEAGGPKGAAALNDISLMEELIKVAPQGPLPGLLADKIGNYTSAGAALDAIIQRNIPTLHVEGSGATSDLEFGSFAKSLPSLKNYPEANEMVLAVMRQKAQIQQQMGVIATKVANRQMSRAEGSAAWQELYSKHLVIPEPLQKMIDVENAKKNGTPAPAVPGNVDVNSPEYRKALDDEIKRREAAGEK